MCKIGNDADTGKAVGMDLPVLVKTRLLIQANSGGGKSYLLRKILEETHGKIQHIVLDMEGEFASLRERHDYILVGKDGDIDISVKIAEMLARKILEINASAIIDLYELKHHERVLFVKRFLNAMVNAPKRLWHPCLVVVDEAHQFCPEKGKAESMPAVIDLATRGRKRGYVGVLATQRLSKLHKDVAAEMINKLIGRTGLDIDMKRASDELGFVSKQDMLELRNLEPGEFFAFGPAISKSIIKVNVGKVATTHPEAGFSMDIAVPPAPESIKKLLKSLEDLPQKAEEELKTVDDLKRKIRELKFELKKKPKPEFDEERYNREFEAYKVGAERQYELKAKKKDAEIKKLHGIIHRIAKNVQKEVDGLPEIENIEETVISYPKKAFPPRIPAFVQGTEIPPKAINDDEGDDNKPLRAGAMKMLKAIAMFHPKPITKFQIAALSRFSVKGGTFNTYLSELRKNSWVVEENKRFTVTKEGMKNSGDIPELPTRPDELVEMWASKFRAGAARMLREIASEYPNPISKEDLGERTNFTISGGTFNTYLSELRRNNLVVVNGDSVRASNELFLED